MTNPPMGEPAYPAPQDPWAGTQGMAATPTDPIPQAPPAFGQFAQGVATPGTPSWSTQDTIVHGGYDYAEPRRRSGVGKYILVVLVVLLLGGGGGFGAWYLITDRYGSTPDTLGRSSPPVSTTGGTPTSSLPPQVAAADLQKDVCIRDLDPEGAHYMVVADCSVVPTYKILKVYRDLDAPAHPEKQDSYLPMYHQYCDGVTGANSFYYYWFKDSTKVAYFFCAYYNGPLS
jgi:hypothetical protein